MAEGFGSVMWWGFSPALDLLAIANEGSTKGSVEASLEKMCIQSDHVNVLLVGSGDLRHLLMTLAYAKQHTSKPVHFYIIESCLEVFARHMLFLSILFEPPDRLGLQEKTELFLELFGNSLLRAQTTEYLKEKATDLIKMVTDFEYLKARIPVLDISGLKFKERDLLEGILKFWRHPDENTFDIKKHWEGRLRHYLGVRYDARSGVFDWDYHMKLAEMTPVVSSQEYRQWRESGVAFRLREDAPYEATNRTLASGLLVSQGGERVARRGYWGDIVNSPYLAFGIESKNKDLFKTVSGKCVKTSMQVSEHNLLSLVHLLTTRQLYTAQATPGSACITQGMGVIEELPDEEQDMDGHAQQITMGSSPSVAATDGQVSHQLMGPLFDGSCFISFLPLNSASELSKKAKFIKLFNIAYFSNSMAHHLTSGINAVFASDCTLVLETARFMLDLKKEQKSEYIRKVTGMAESIGFKMCVSSAASEVKDCNYLHFTTSNS